MPETRSNQMLKELLIEELPRFRRDLPLQRALDIGAEDRGLMRDGRHYHNYYDQRNGIFDRSWTEWFEAGRDVFQAASLAERSGYGR